MQDNQEKPLKHNQNDAAPRGQSEEQAFSQTGPSVQDVLEQQTSKASEKPRPSRPPLWLIVFTVAIPVTLGLIWYSNWYGRPLDGMEMRQAFEGDEPSEHYHALYQFSDQMHAFNQLKINDPQRLERFEALRVCFDALLHYAEASPEKLPLQAATADALGLFVFVKDLAPEQTTRARSLLENFFIQGKEMVRFQAATALARFGDRSQAVMGTLLNMLQHSDPKVRANAASALGIVGSSLTASELKRVADTDQDPVVREIALKAWEHTAGQVLP